MDSKDRGWDNCIVSNHDDSNGTSADDIGNLDVAEPPKKRARKDSNKKKNPHRTYYQYEGWNYESVQFTWNPADQSNAASIQYSPRRLDDDVPPPPCTPLRYFQSSFRASPPSPVALDDTSATTSITLQAEMIVHQHRNGLCVVTVANGAALWQHMESAGSAFRWKYPVEATPADLSMAQTRKRNSKLLSQLSSKGREAGVVTPTDVLATLEIVHDDQGLDEKPKWHLQIQFPCAVLGSILELNRHYERATTMEALHRLLVADAYSIGYLAVILPAGPFPPCHREANAAETTVTIQ